MLLFAPELWASAYLHFSFFIWSSFGLDPEQALSPNVHPFLKLGCLLFPSSRDLPRSWSPDGTIRLSSAMLLRCQASLRNAQVHLQEPCFKHQPFGDESELVTRSLLSSVGSAGHAHHPRAGWCGLGARTSRT